MFTLIETWSAKRRAVAELSRLPDRALADLGIARADIASIAATAAALRVPAARKATLPLPGHRQVPAWA